MPRGFSIYDEARLQGRLAAYTDVIPQSDLLAWWDPTTGVSLSSGKVTSHTDRIRGIVLQPPSAGAGPGVGLVNGMQALNFVGGDQLIGTGFSVPQPFIVSQGFVAGASQTGFAYTFHGNPSDGAACCVFVRRQDQNNLPAIFAGSNVTIFPSVIPANSPFNSDVSFNGSSSYAIVNGVKTATFNPGAGGITGKPAIGSTDNTNNSIRGQILDTLIIRRLTPSQAEVVHAIRAWRWKLQDALAPTSRFRNRPPLIGD